MQLSHFLSREDNDRVFVFQSSNQISSQNILYIKNRLNNDFFHRWFSHNEKIMGECILLYNHFLIVSACCNHISGCSIDSLVHEIKLLESELSINLFNRKQIAFNIVDTQSCFSELANLEIQFLDYQDCVDYLSSRDDKNIVVFNNSIMSSHETWIMPINTWLNQLSL